LRDVVNYDTAYDTGAYGNNVSPHADSKKRDGLEIFQLVLSINPLKPELNPICYLLALLGAHHFLHVSRIRVKLLTLR
jgi:transposase